MSRSLKLTRPSSIRLILDPDGRIRHPASSRLIPRASRNWRRWAPSIMRKAVGPPVEALRVAGVVTVDLRLLKLNPTRRLGPTGEAAGQPGEQVPPLGLARYGAELVDLSEADHVRGVGSSVWAREAIPLFDAPRCLGHGG